MIKAYMYPYKNMGPKIIDGEIVWDESDDNKLVLERPGSRITIDTSLIDVIIEDTETQTTKLWQAYNRDC